MKRVLPAVFVVLSLCALGVGAESVVSINVVPPEGGLKAGQPGVLTLELDIQKPYHINSDKPAESFLIPTTVKFTEQSGLVFGNVVFPPAPLKKLPISENAMSVYEGLVRITAEVTASQELVGKEVPIQGTVRYQSCNDNTCLPPVRASFKATVPVAAGNGVQSSATTPTAAVADEAQAGAVAAKAAQAGQDAKPSDGSGLGGRGLLSTFLFVFIGGLALNLTPCVYPMIPITISYFGGQSEGKKGSLLLHSSIYVIGMATTYSILGSVAALTGSLFGAALQYPAVLIGIALIMVLLALSMFDVYELRMPSFLNRLAGQSHGGLFGTFFMGLTVGIVAAPCIGPFVLTLLTYVGSTGDPVLGFSLFFVLALGLGVPFIFLGAFSGGLSRMPKSGGWMIWVRKIFGFVLIGMAIYFLRPLFPSELLFFMTFALTMLLGGVYMAWLEPSQGRGAGFVYLRNIVGLIFFGIALYLSFTGVQAHVDQAIAKKVRDLGPGANAAVIQWAPYSDAKLAEAAQAGKPVFIDFFADWCVACKEMEHLTFSTPEVAGVSKDFVMLQVDMTSAEDPAVAALQKKYDVKGLPTYVFLKPDGSELAELRGTGFEAKEVFLPKMKQAIDASASARP
jgi:thiol:disulfide interchange protein DsbD